MWEVSWRPIKDGNILTPPTLLAITAFLSGSPRLLNRGPGGGQPLGHGSVSSIFSPTDWLSVAPGLYNCSTYTYFFWASHLHSIQPVDSQGIYPLISSTGCTCYLHRCISHLTAWLGRRSICNILFLIFFSTELRSSCVNCPSLMSNCLLIILVIGSCVSLGGFPSKFSKCCFHMCIRSSWLIAFSLAFA